MGILERILRETRDSLTELRRIRLPAPPERRSVELRRQNGALRLIAEIKHRSPSAGLLSKALGVAERGQAYERAGASMISVLCDRGFFDGAFEHLELVRRHTQLPVLCKAFVLDPVQLDLARAFGADAVLLIVRCLTKVELRNLLQGALERDLEPLVEVVSNEEAELALDAGAQLIGVNARDLDTFAMDSERAESLVNALPESVLRAYFSGVGSPEDVRRVSKTRADAALIGESLMRKDDPEPLLRELVAAARPRLSSQG